MRGILFIFAAAALLSTTCAQSNIQILEDRDPFTDADRSRVTVQAEDQSMFGRTNAIMWRCAGEDEYELFVATDEYLGGDRIPMIYRFDDASAVTERWDESTTGTAAFARREQANTFTQAAVAADRVVIGLTNFRGQRYEYTFRLVGLRPMLHALGCVQAALQQPERPPAVTQRPTAELEDVLTDVSTSEAYDAVILVAGDEPYTQGQNVIYFNGLTVTFDTSQATSRLRFEGTNTELYQSIRSAFIDGGTSSTPPPPLRETRPRPLAVLVDNVLGYPQSGLPHASWIAEIPIEGGATRLMAVFDRRQPDRIGPVRGARDYFVDLAADSDSVLVHDGGSPSALVALQTLPAAHSLNAERRDDLFRSVSSADAPYNLFAEGGLLRDAIGSLNIDTQRLLTGFRPTPPADDLPRAERIDIDWSETYGSGFRYVPGQDRYRWIRNGQDAVDASGGAVQVDAILIARIQARVIPGDTAGRLYIPVQGGEATLHWRGAVQEGTWSVDGGLRFTGPDGVPVSLEAITTWAAFVPQGAEVATR